MVRYINADKAKAEGWRATRTNSGDGYVNIETIDITRLPVAFVSTEIIGWVSVEDEMPMPEEVVIVTILDDSGDRSFRYADVGWWSGYDDKWIVDNEFTTRVTHWMSFPRPFEEVE